MVILAECKLTGSNYAVAQMKDLYTPLLVHIYQRPVFCLQVCKNVTADTPGPYVLSPDDFMNKGHEYATWHWPGR